MPFGVCGRVKALSGLTIEASDLALPLGSMCRINSLGGRTCFAAAVAVVGQVRLQTWIEPTYRLAHTTQVSSETLRAEPEAPHVSKSGPLYPRASQISISSCRSVIAAAVAWVRHAASESVGLGVVVDQQHRAVGVAAQQSTSRSQPGSPRAGLAGLCRRAALSATTLPQAVPG